MEEKKVPIFLCAGEIVIVLQLVKWTMGMCPVSLSLDLTCSISFHPSYPVSLGCKTLLKVLR